MRNTPSQLPTNLLATSVTETRIPRLALLCDRAGVIQKILCDDFFPAETLLPGQAFAEWVDPGSRDKVSHLLADVNAQGSAFDWELNVAPQGKVITLHFSGFANDASLLIVGDHNRNDILQLQEESMRINNDLVNTLRAAIKDQTERKQAEDALKNINELLNLRIIEVEKLQTELREQSIRDSQTGLFNRRYLDETLTREVVRAERENAPLSVIMSDIDLFKIINDTYGHPVGDKFLVEVASLMKNHARGSDIVCRYGGEEFLLVLPGSALDSAAKRAEEIRQKCAEIIIQHEGKDLKVTISFGVATYPNHGKEAEEIIIKADKALYQSKHSGRNRVTVWSETQ